MRWEDERYVRVYTRDTADWLALSFDAQSLFMHLLRKVDRAGILELGRHGKRAVAIAIGHAALWDRLAPALEELLADGCVQINETRLLIPNYIEAQEARASDKARQREKRERDRARTADEPSPPPPPADDPNVTERDAPSRNVTGSHEKSRGVTRGHAASHDVTPYRAVPSRAEPTTEPPNPPVPGGSPSAAGAAPVGGGSGGDGERDAKPEKPAAPKRECRPRERREGDPAPMPWTIAEWLADLEAAAPARMVLRPFDPGLAKPLTAVIRAVAAMGSSRAETAVVGAWFAAGGEGYLRDGVALAWLAKPGNYTSALAKARAWHTRGRPPIPAQGTLATLPARPVRLAPAAPSIDWSDDGPDPAEEIARAARLRATGGAA